MLSRPVLHEASLVVCKGTIVSRCKGGLQLLGSALTLEAEDPKFHSWRLQLKGFQVGSDVKYLIRQN